MAKSFWISKQKKEELPVLKSMGIVTKQQSTRPTQIWYTESENYKTKRRTYLER